MKDLTLFVLVVFGHSRKMTILNAHLPGRIYHFIRRK